MAKSPAGRESQGLGVTPVVLSGPGGGEWGRARGLGHFRPGSFWTFLGRWFCRAALCGESSSRAHFL